MSISVDGIISGINTSGLIAEMLAGYSAPKGILENQIDLFGDLREALTGLSTRLSELSDALEGLSTPEEFRSYATSYPETNSFTATANGEAIPGVYGVAVSALANSELEVSQGFDDQVSTGTIPEGTLTVTVGGVDTQIVVDSTNSSLVELASSIDQVEGVNAYVMNTGESSQPYRLVIQGEETGSSNTIEVDTTGLVGAGTVPGFTEQVSASDAQASINGISVTSTSNTFNNVIEGITFEVSGLTTDPVNVVVSLDSSAMADKLQTFIDAYNEVVSFVDTNSLAANSEVGIPSGPLNGDSSARWILQTLRSKISDQYGTGSLDSLSLMGISSGSDGKLSLNTGDFQAAFQTDPSSVEGMFTSESGFGANMVTALDVFIDPIDGSLKQRGDSIDSSIDRLEIQVESWEDRIERYENRLRSSFTAFEGAAGQLQGTAQFLQSYFFSNQGG